MLRKHSKAIARINADTQVKAQLLQYFGIDGCPEYLTPALYSRGLGQADLVLGLLRIRDTIELRRRARSYVEALIGHPITVGAPCLLLYRTNGKPRPSRKRLAEERRVVFVAENPRARNTGASMRWSEIKLGRTFAELRSRGVWKRDIRLGLRKGWLKFEDVGAENAR